MTEHGSTVVRNRWKRPVILVAAACAIGAGVLSGCGSSATSTAGTGTSSSATSTPPSSSAGMPATATMIMIDNFSYKTPASVVPGATVSVMNMDGEAHTVTSDKNGALAVTVPAGTTATFSAPTTAGSYEFHCDYHSNMHGTLVVK